MAPSFDHASSLGRELLDNRRQRLLSERQFGKYSEKARGGIFWKPEDAHAISPLQLVRRGTASHPDFFRASIEPLRNVERGSFEGIVRRVPAGWMTELERTFAVELMCYNLDQLLRINV